MSADAPTIAEFVHECSGNLTRTAWALATLGLNPDAPARGYANHITLIDPHTLHGLRAELEQLRRWKAEAMTVLAEWEDVWIAAGRPGDLGRSKAAGVFEFVRRAMERPQ